MTGQLNSSASYDLSQQNVQAHEWRRHSYAGFAPKAFVQNAGGKGKNGLTRYLKWDQVFINFNLKDSQMLITNKASKGALQRKEMEKPGSVISSLIL